MPLHGGDPPLLRRRADCCRLLPKPQGKAPVPLLPTCSQRLPQDTPAARSAEPVLGRRSRTIRGRTRTSSSGEPTSAEVETARRSHPLVTLICRSGECRTISVGRGAPWDSTIFTKTGPQVQPKCRGRRQSLLRAASHSSKPAPQIACRPTGRTLLYAGVDSFQSDITMVENFH